MCWWCLCCFCYSQQQQQVVSSSPLYLRSLIDLPAPPPPSCFYKWEKETIAYLNSAYRDFNDMVSQGYSTISDYNTLFSSLLNINQHSTVIRLAQNLDLESVTPDINTWLILITCYAKNGHISSAFSLFSKIINAGYRPSSSNMNDLFCCLLAPGHVYQAMLLHNYILLKGGFRLSYNTYHHLVGSLCEIGETKRAIHLFRKIEMDLNGLHEYQLEHFYSYIIRRLCKDRLVHQAYDFYSEMTAKNISCGSTIYRNLIYGYCIVGQFKQAIAFFRQFGPEPPLYILPCPSFNLALASAFVTDGEVKDAKSAVAVMVKHGVKPNVASYHSIIDELYKGQRVGKIAKTVETLLLNKLSIGQPYYIYS